MGILGLYLIGKSNKVTDINLHDEMVYQDFVLAKLTELGSAK
jgi:hypothetical protein